MKLSRARDNSSLPNLKVTVYWGDILYDTVYCHPKDSVTVGRKSSNTVVVPLEGAGARESLEMVKVLEDNTVELLFDETITGHVRLGDEFLRLQGAIDEKKAERQPDGMYRVKMHHKDEADLVIGHVSFYLNWTKNKVILPRSSVGENKKSMIVSGVLTLFLFLMMGLSSLFQHPVEEAPPERLVTLEPRPEPPKVRAKAAIGVRKTADGGAEKGELGKATLTAKPTVSMADKLKSELSSGDLVKDLADIGTSAPSRRTVTGKESAGVSAAIDQVGTGGFSTEGFKTGGGGVSKGIGRTVGQGEGGFEGTGRLGLSGNSAVEGGTGYGAIETVSEGGLDRDVIDAIVQKRKTRIRLCYERQLNFNPSLTGKVSVAFVIAANGSVKSANIAEDTMRSSDVNQCILQEVKAWVFPPPKGGTLVDVQYPFVFESSVKN